MGKRLFVALVVIAASCGMAGCAGFEGKRQVDLKLGILGNSLEWHSSVNGQYTQESPVVK